MNDKPEQNDNAWAGFLSVAATKSSADLEVTPRVLNALQQERASVADGSAWARYLSSGAVLNPVDANAVRPALQAVRLERVRSQRWRLNVTRWVAGAMATAAVVAAVLVFNPPSASADPSEAYNAYQEAARGW
jgi:lipase chaperone LimK